MTEHTDPILPDSEIPEDMPAAGGEKKEQRSFARGLYEYIELFCYALALMIIMFMFVFRYVSVEGSSMVPTLHENDNLVISHIAYTPKTGDIVVVKHKPKPIIKRVIATAGQTVRIDYEKWEVYVDGVLLDEPYINKIGGMMTRYNGKDEYTISDGMVFVMGDNRNLSSDSRSFGEVKESDVIGRVMFRVFPISEFGKVK